MKDTEILKLVKDRLELANITDSAEAEWLVALALGIRRSEISLGKQITKEQEDKVKEFLMRRLNREPLSQIVGNCEFFGREFMVSRDCLTPRPETEELVLFALKRIKPTDSVLDIGTGSGAIAVTIALESKAKVTAVDISKAALGIAKKNSRALGASVEFVLSNLFLGLGERKFDKIISNPPYISATEYERLESEVKDFEPKIALFAEDNGLAVYKKIISEAPAHLKRGGEIFFEIGYRQGAVVKELLEKDFENIEIIKDLEGQDRIVYATKK